MRALLQLLSVPITAICLVLMLAVVGGMEQGTVTLTDGCLSVGAVLVMVYGALWAFDGGDGRRSGGRRSDRKEKEDDEIPDD